MASNIVEFFGYSPHDKSQAAISAREKKWCPFQDKVCTKTLNRGEPSGACTLKSKTGGPVICCPIRLYAEKFKILADIAKVAFGASISLLTAGEYTADSGECAVIFGKGSGQELRLPNRSTSKSGAYFVDWIIVHLDKSGSLVDFVAVEVQSIDTTGNYQSERLAYLEGKEFPGSSTAGFNWENVNKRILPQLIYKGHVLRREPLCPKGLFFVCPTPVYDKIRERIGGKLEEYEFQHGSLTLMWYNIGPAVGAGDIRELQCQGRFTTTVDQVAHAFVAPQNLPPAKVYETAIRTTLQK